MRKMFFLILGLLLLLPTSHAQDAPLEPVAQYLNWGGLLDGVWSPDGTQVAISSTHRAGVFGASDLTLDFELETAPYTQVGQLSWSPSGQYIAGGNSVIPLYNTSTASETYLWDASTGEVVHTLLLTNSLNSVRAWYWLANETSLMAHTTNEVLLWDLESGNVLNSLEVEEPIFDLSIEEDTFTLHFRSFTMSYSLETFEFLSEAEDTGDQPLFVSPDGTVSVFRDGRSAIEFRDNTTGQTLGRYENESGRLMLPNTAPQWTSDGETVIFVAGRRNSVIAVTIRGELVQRLTLTGFASVQSVALGPNDDSVLITEPTIVHMWNWRTGEFETPQRILSGGSLQGIDWHENVIATASQSDPFIQLWDANTGELQQSFTSARPYFTSVAFSPDGQFIAGGDSNYYEALGDENIPHPAVSVWDVSTGEEVLNLPIVPLEERDYRNEGAFVHRISWSPDGTKLLGIRMDNATGIISLRVWDASTGEELFATDEASDAATWSPDGQTLLYATWDLNNPEIELVATTIQAGSELAGVTTPPMVEEIARIDSESFVRHLAWRPDSNQVLIWLDDQFAIIDAVDNFGEQRFISEDVLVRPYTAPVWNGSRLSFASSRISATGQPLAEAQVWEFSEDGTTATQIQRFETGNPNPRGGLWGTAWQGNRIAGIDLSGAIHIWEVVD